MDDLAQNLGIALSRFGHYLSGITWIGLLYYFNFVQTPSFAQFEAAPRTEAIRKLVPRALWWFRYGALLTLLFGLSILAFQEQLTDGEYWMDTPPGASIGAGIILAVIMFANVWFVIWPAQKIIIASAEGVAAGREADPAAAPAGRRAALASRTNTFLSIPMLLFMGLTSHFAAGYFEVGAEFNNGMWFGLVIIIAGIIELNGLGMIGGTEGPGTKFLGDHKQVIIGGFVLTALFLALFHVLYS